MAFPDSAGLVRQRHEVEVLLETVEHRLYRRRLEHLDQQIASANAIDAQLNTREEQLAFWQPQLASAKDFLVGSGSWSKPVTT